MSRYDELDTECQPFGASWQFLLVFTVFTFFPSPVNCYYLSPTPQLSISLPFSCSHFQVPHVPAVNHGSCIHHPGLDNSHDSLRAKELAKTTLILGKINIVEIHNKIMRFTTYVIEQMSNILGG